MASQRHVASHRHMHLREPRKNTCGAIRLHGRGLLIPSLMAKKSKEEREFETHWREIQKCIGTCAAAYAELVAAADKLAELSGLDRGVMLDECQPGSRYRDSLPVLANFFERHRNDLREDWCLKRKIRQRDALMERLGLTEEEREILLWCASD